MFGKVIADFPLQVYISGLLFSPTQSMTRILFEAEAPTWARIWPENGAVWTPCLRRFEGHENYISELDISSCGTWLASSAADETIKIWEIKTGRMIQSMKVANGGSRGGPSPRISFSPWKSNELASQNVGKDGIIIWDVTTTKIIQQLAIGIFRRIQTFSFLPSTRNSLGCHFRNEYGKPDLISIWDTERGQNTYSVELPSLRGLDYYIVAFSPMGSSNVYATTTTTSNGRDGRESHGVVEIRNANADNNTRTLQQYGRVINIQFSPMGHLLVVQAEANPDSRSECSITLFDAVTGSTIWKTMTQLEFYSSTSCPTFLNDGRLALKTYGNKMEIWDAVSGQYLQKCKIKSGYLGFLLGGNGKEFFIANGNFVEVMELGTAEFLSQVSSDDDTEQPSGYDVAISPDGKMLAATVSRPSETITVWDIALKKSIFTQNFNCNAPRHLIAFSPDSRRLVCRAGSNLYMWDISSSGSFKVFFSYDFNGWGSPFRPIFSSDSQRLANAQSYSTDKLEVEVWDVNSLKRVISLRGGELTRLDDTCFALSPDGKLLAVSWISYARKRRVEIWDIASSTGIGTISFPPESFDSYFKKMPQFSGSLVNAYEPEEIELKHLSFLDNSHVALDLYKGSDFRAVLRTRMDSPPAAESEDYLSRAHEENCYGVEPTNFWVTFEGERVLWLPPEHRGKRYPWDSQKNCVVVSTTHCDRLTIIEFCCSNCLKQMLTSDATVARSTCCSPDEQSYTYTRGLHDWTIECFDMEPPDDQMLEIVKMNTTDLSKLALANKQR
jgi:WD40 repeat protein